MRISFLGTRGVPARYGGFETAVEEIGRRLSERGHEVVVYCRTADPVSGASYLGMARVVRPAIRRKSLETLSHSILSLPHARRARSDAYFVLNVANLPVAGMLPRGRVALHVDGLEWKRQKWGHLGRAYFRLAERIAARSHMELITDSQALADYFEARYSRESWCISYGAKPPRRTDGQLVTRHGVSPREYHLVVARFEPENHVREIVDAYTQADCRYPLLVVGSAPYGSHAKLVAHPERYPRVILSGSVWDQDELDDLYANCLQYIHGHSVGGTNPSLLRAMAAGAPALIYDVPFNREVVGPGVRTWRTIPDLTRLFELSETQSEAMAAERERNVTRSASYNWDRIAEQYEELARTLADRGA